MLSHRIALIVAGIAPVLVLPAHADLLICNRMSYVVETAIGLEDKGAVATRGWFRVDPGQCRAVIQGALEAERIYLHARAHPIYGSSPLPESGHADLCVAQGSFTIAAARHCRSGQRPTRFTEVKPSEGEKGSIVNLAEEAEYTEEQARDAGIQRLLVVAGYDANPIDGIRGTKTDAALIAFLHDNKLPATSAARSDFFDVLLAAAQKVEVTGLSWCNDTIHTVMAAIGTEEKGAITTRGWYRLEPGKCVRPELNGQPKRVFSFAEAIDASGNAIKRGNKPLAWGGDTVLCTRNVRFELAEHANCVARGLTSAGFAAIDLAGRGATVRFK
jgi:uncharacterized membrane protein